MRWIAAFALIAAASALAAPVPAQYGWQRDAMYVYRVKIQTTESGDRARYLAIFAGHVVYHCRAANPHGFTLRSHSLAAIARHTTAGKRFPPFGVFRLGWKHFDGRQAGKSKVPPTDIIFRSNGQVISRNSAGDREFDFTDLGRLVLAQLGTTNQVKWTATEPVQIHHQTRVSAPGTVRLVRVDTVRLPGTLAVNYFREKDSLSNTLLLETESLPGIPRVRIEGSGGTVFDDAGIPVRHSWAGKIFITENGQNRTVPVTIDWHRLTGADAMHVLRPPAPVARQERRALAGDELKATLAQLRQPFSRRRAQLLQKIVIGDPKPAGPKLREDTAAVLVGLLRHNDPFMRRDAARALANWGTPKSVPALIAALGDRQMTVRWAAVDALGSLRDPRGMGPVAKHLASGKEIAACVNALGFFGRANPGIETHLTPLLTNKNEAVRLETCLLLADFGSVKSKPPLSLAAFDSDPEVAKAARAALQAITERP